MKAVFVLLCCAAAAVAQEVTPCTSPTTWEARVLRLDHKRREEVFAKLSYDEVNRRIRIIDEVFIGQTKNFYDSLYLHNVGLEYHVDLKTKKCNTTALTRPFRPFGIPQDASFRGEAYVGGAVESEGVLVQFWEGNSTSGGHYNLEWTYPSCIPVADFYFSRETGLEITDFFDVTLGISNPNVFLPPPECQT